MIAPSYFMDLAQSQNLQAILDRSALFLQAQSIWRNYLTEAPPQFSLTFDSAIGRERISAAASIVDTDAPAPLRSRPTLERYTGTIPAIKEKFRLSQTDMRNIAILRALPVLSGGGNDALINFLVRDLQEASVSGDKRIDIMMLQGLSTGKIDVNITNNPDGAALGVIDLLFAAYQIQGVPKVWSDITSKPLDDIQNYVTANALKRGRQFSRILMPYTAWLNFRATTQVQNALAVYFVNGNAVASGAQVTVQNVNDWLVANLLPTIEIVNYYANVESDGKLVSYQPFDQANVVFLPAGPVGTLQNAIPMERVNRVPNKTYADFGPTLVSKWLEQDPLVEFTAMEMNAFPALNIDSIYILDTDLVFAGPFI